jgi:hypothetical protein
MPSLVLWKICLAFLNQALGSALAGETKNRVMKAIANVTILRSALFGLVIIHLLG